MEISQENSVIDARILQRISPNQAWLYRVIPVKEEGGVLYLNIDEEVDLRSTRNELQLLLDGELKLSPIPKSEINYSLGKYYRINHKMDKFVLSEHEDFFVKMVAEAQQSNCSDIHIEPFEKKCVIRYRIDGHLIEKFEISKEDYFTLLNQIKIKSNLDIAEKRLPQDGRIQTKGDNGLDLRISILPTLNGEKVVMRLLSKDASIYDLKKLGFTNEQLKIYFNSVDKKSGIVLISGPTNSGKTTTLYATLSRLNKKNVNILTAENPVEYSIKGVNQVQIKDSIGLTFAAALRSFLRQDPNVIMIGEIRDRETAEMAIRASLTGHLVLSTIHTNSAVGTITRLIDEGVPEYLIADTLNISVAQRLLRKLCDECKILCNEYELDEIKKDFKGLENKNLYKAGECAHCHYTGYSGRMALYEILPISSEVRNLIRSNDLDKIQEKAEFERLKDRATDMILSGQTSWSEVKQYIIN